MQITIPVKGGDALETWRKYFNEIPGPCWAGPLVPEERDPSYFDQIPKPSLEASVQDTVEWGYHLRGMWPFWAAWAAISGLATLTPEGAESTTDGLHYGLGQLFIKVMRKYTCKKWSIWGALCNISLRVVHSVRTKYYSITKASQTDMSVQNNSSIKYYSNLEI